VCEWIRLLSERAGYTLTQPVIEEKSQGSSKLHCATRPEDLSLENIKNYIFIVRTCFWDLYTGGDLNSECEERNLVKVHIHVWNRELNIQLSFPKWKKR